MIKRKKLPELMNEWKTEPDMMERIVHWHTRQEKPPQYADFPQEMHDSLKAALRKKGIEQLYTHQREAFDLAAAGGQAGTGSSSGASTCR